MTYTELILFKMWCLIYDHPYDFTSLKIWQNEIKSKI